MVGNDNHANRKIVWLPKEWVGECTDAHVEEFSQKNHLTPQSLKLVTHEIIISGRIQNLIKRIQTWKKIIMMIKDISRQQTAGAKSKV